MVFVPVADLGKLEAMGYLWSHYGENYVLTIMCSAHFVLQLEYHNYLKMSINFVSPHCALNRVSLYLCNSACVQILGICRACMAKGLLDQLVS